MKPVVISHNMSFAYLCVMWTCHLTGTGIEFSTHPLHMKHGILLAVLYMS